MRLLPSGRSEAFAVIAGTESAIRKIATPASSARTITAAIVAPFEKIRSPGRRRPPEAEARIWPAWVGLLRGLPCGLSRTGPRPPGGGPVQSESAADRVDRGLILLLDSGRDRG